MSVSLGELAVRFGCELRGDPDRRVEHVATLANADERSLAFLANPRYRQQLLATRAGAVVLGGASAAECPTAMLLSENPYATYARIAAVLHPLPAVVPGVHPTALVSPGARVDPSAQLAAYCTIGDRVVVGARSFIGPHSILAEGATLAADVRLTARVTLGPRVSVGKRCMIDGISCFAGHLTMADDVFITDYSAVTHSIRRPGVYSGSLPFEEAHAWRRLVARFKRSGLLAARVRRLERAAGLKSDQEEPHD